MTIFYWVMGSLTVLCFVPSVFFLVLYGVTGEDACVRRAKAFWQWAKVFGLGGFNITIWGHVIVGLWRLAAG
jgi:hypothetical protein